MEGLVLMDRKTLGELDYYRIRDEIAGFCVSEEGKASLLCRDPFSSVSDFEELKKLSREWFVCFGSGAGISLKSWPAIREYIPVIKATGATLSVEQLYAMGIFCMNAREITESIVSCEEDLNLKRLAALVRGIPDLSGAENEIFKIIDKNGGMKDLPELRELKSSIQNIRRETDNAFKKFTSGSAYASVLESTLPVVRADRQVLAVKSSERSKIKGIIHEVSNSGRTVFIEPDEVVRLNNDLIQKEFELEQAARKILTELTGRLSEYAAAFSGALEIMIRLDTTASPARWGLEHNCIFAQNCLDETTPPLLLQARHPLLKEKAVPIDIKFLSAKRILIITGPNTGGKTVAIKTFALFAMLNQSGFPLPASEGSCLPVFDSVYADIGDEQSIDASLSTFSAHMKNIAAALNQACEKSLVLLDELGSGTDPLEGSAIAMAALDELIARGSFVLVTTHHGVLKNYGWTNPVCENASVEFDTSSLRPTYRLVMGIPGESHALEIAENSGIPSDLVKKARGYIQSQAADVSALIKGLNQKHSELDSLLRKMKEREESVMARALKNEETEIRLRRREHDLKVAQNKEESNFLRDSRRKLENLVRELKEGEITRAKTLAVKEFKENLAASEKIHSEILDAEENNLLRDEEKLEEKKNSHKSNKVKKGRVKNSEALKKASPTLKNREKCDKDIPLFLEGAKVFSIATGAEGILIRKEKGDKWTVQFGALKIQACEKDLRLAEKQEALKVSAWQYTPSAGGEGQRSEQPVYELRLLGFRTDEALAALQKQIDLCVIHGLNNFSVIHGKGTGALQKAVQDYLEKSPAVKEFSFAPAEDGGFGKTYVLL